MRNLRKLAGTCQRLWLHFWMRLAGVRYCRRTATRFALLFGPVYYERQQLAEMNRWGFISPKATLHFEGATPLFCGAKGNVLFF